MRLVVTDEAKRDMADIGNYSKRTWGAEQARTYRGLIIQSFAKLLERPSRGRLQDNLAPSVRRLNVRRHAVFYFVRGEDLVISRVLHQSMDFTAAFFPESS
jgi:toxin ParE1/3/4